jgi:DNA modification methylase
MTVRIINASVFDGLRQLPDESVHCCVTSPPYWGLRDYGTGTWEGGDPECQHKVRENTSVASSTLGGGKKTTGHQREGYKGKCGRCGAKRIDAQIGLEPTLGEHIAKMVEVFREVRRVLRKDGTVWLNYGDCYATAPNGRSAADTKAVGNDDRTFRDKPFSTIGGVLKPKDLCMIPHRLAIALQEDGWWVRADIVWAKPNPMPESITDRPAKAHEYVFLLTKAERYFYDAEAIKEPLADSSIPRLSQDIANQIGTTRANGGAKTNGNLKAVGDMDSGLRNKRSVWSIATQPYSEAHFATFPPELPETCIKAGTSQKGCCLECGAPWVRGVERPSMVIERSDRTHEKGRTRASGTMVAPPTTKTTGWAPSCKCGAATPVPCTVLDPFLGAGTTALVADRLQRHAVGIELNPEYAALAERRINSDRGGLLDVMEGVA